MPKVKRNQSEIELEKVIEVCKKNYRSHPNVVQVGGGLKLTNNRVVDEKLCVHFYVRKKTKEIKPKGRILPKFVYNRLKDGSIDYSKKIPTDVISIEGLRFACRAGTNMEVFGESGTITLIFKNKVPNQSRFYAITCAHVAGDVRQSPPIYPEVKSACCQAETPFATTVVNSTQNNGYVNFDIALAVINEACEASLNELEVNGTQTKIESFLSAEEIRPPMLLNCAFSTSSLDSAVLTGFRTTLPIILDRVEYQVGNLFPLDRAPAPGDSGGLLYSGSAAVGILVAIASNEDNDVGFFQPLGEAFEHTKEILGEPLQVF